MKRDLKSYYTGFGIRFELNGIMIKFFKISNFNDSGYKISDEFGDKIKELPDSEIMEKYPECFI